MRSDKVKVFYICLFLCLVSLLTGFKPNNKNVVMFGDGHIVKAGKHFSCLDEKNVSAMQKSLDKGITVTAYNELDNRDGKLTYFAGHNPGVMSKFAKFVKDNREVRVYDKNGDVRYYVLSFLADQSRGERYACDEVTSVVDNADELEGILFQFCRGKRMEFWLAVPKDK